MAGQCWFVYHSWIQAFQALSPAELGRLTLCALQYSAQGTESELAGNERYTWPIIKSQIDRDNEHYAEISRKRKIAGSKSRANATNCNQLQAIATNCSIENEKEKEKKTASQRGRLPNPTLEEVAEFAKSRNSTVDPQKFFDYFDAGNWTDAKGQPVLNWKQKFITWEKFDVKEAPKREPQENPDSYDYWLSHDTGWKTNLYQGGGYDK